MTEKTNQHIPLSDYDIEREGSNITEPDATEPFFNPSNKRKIGAECSVKVTDKKICGRRYLSENSTSNLISYLVGSHQITENT
ncbi:hypothetical protein RCL_jg16154.t1 [Rhizophagus clarus]|uniref:Uncharacterized protein n=1 Tax=Rhizophagus clarus TaxID=94130 RepID=A0A8H3LB03_9GLOM|nr:hypothetical protein RCL_jg16154.t1 [Rhizophagus clarus]